MRVNKIHFEDSSVKFAHYVSIIFNPTTLGIISTLMFSIVFASSRAEASQLFLISFSFGVLFPFLYLFRLWRNNRVDSLDVPERTQRTTPYLIASISYLIGVVLLIYISAPWQIVALIVCYLGNTLIVVGINLFWKISAHAIGVGAVVTAFGITVSPLYFFALLLLPLVGWSRIKLEMHTFGQVVMGSVLSVISTTIQFSIVERLYL